MTESEAAKPKLKVIKGGKRRGFEPPEGFDLEEATGGPGRLHQAVQSETLIEPVHEGTGKMPSLEEHKRAKALADEIDRTAVDELRPEK